MLKLDNINQVKGEFAPVIKDMREFSKNDSMSGIKSWEYPFIYLWLKKLSKRLKRKPVVMDFGCGVSFFAEYLVSKGFEVWGVDDNSQNDMPLKKLKNVYPNVKYWIGDVKEFNEVKFDAIVSSSVMEHITPMAKRVKVLNILKELLNKDGKMLHIIDHYLPVFTEIGLNNKIKIQNKKTNKTQYLDIKQWDQMEKNDPSSQRKYIIISKGRSIKRQAKKQQENK